MPTVLVVDDDRSIRHQLETALNHLDLVTVGDATEGIEWLKENRADCVLLDIMLPGTSGLEVFQRIKTLDNKLPVIFITAGSSSETTIKAMQLGAKVVTLSDSAGYIHDKEGINEEKLAFVMELKNEKRGRIKEYVAKYPSATYVEGKRPWEVPCDIALPCATQNELNEAEAKMLLSNGCICVAEGANMPCTPEAITAFQKAKILFSPGKASNAGGVATSGLEMSQNSLRLSWTRAEVDDRLHEIMNNIHAACVKYGKEGDGYVDYVKGANIAGFVKVAEAMLAQGVV